MGIKRFFGIFNKFLIFTQLSFSHLIFSPVIMDHLLNIVDQGIKLVVTELQNALLIDVIPTPFLITVALPILIIIPAPCFLGIGDPFPPFYRPFLSMLIPTSVICYKSTNDQMHIYHFKVRVFLIISAIETRIIDCCFRPRFHVGPHNLYERLQTPQILGTTMARKAYPTFIIHPHLQEHKIFQQLIED